MLIARSHAGAYLLPASIKRHPLHVQRALHDLAEQGAAIRQIEDLVEQAIPDLRADGCSWAQIGAALGITGETARSRYRDLEDS